MNITVLAYIERENARKRDPVVDQVAEALRAGGHEVRVLTVHGDIHKLITGLCEPERPDLVFNLMESFGDGYFGAVGVVGLMDLLGLGYVGGGPGEFYLQEDKGLAKKLLAYEKIRYPRYAVCERGEPRESDVELRMPVIVKPLRMDASIGIDGKALVANDKDLWKRVAMVHEKVEDAALLEEYIDGREFHVGVLGNGTPVALPPIEIDFSKMPAGKPHILDAKAKWDVKSDEYKGTQAVVAQLPKELDQKLRKVAVEACKALRVRDYGRVDLRVDEDGEVYVIEVNASCYLEKDSEFAVAAKAAGIEYEALILRILEVARERLATPRVAG